MNDETIPLDIDKIVKHWLDTADEDFETMLYLFNAKSYSWALFLGHISVEKTLKAYYVWQLKNHAPFTHNLYRLAELSGLALTQEYADWLDEITAFNINARYDDYKREFYALCTAEFFGNWIEKIKIIRIWIKQQL